MSLKLLGRLGGGAPSSWETNRLKFIRDEQKERVKEQKEMEREEKANAKAKAKQDKEAIANKLLEQKDRYEISTKMSKGIFSFTIRQPKLEDLLGRVVPFSHDEFENLCEQLTEACEDAVVSKLSELSKKSKLSPAAVSSTAAAGDESENSDDGLDYYDVKIVLPATYSNPNQIIDCRSSKISTVVGLKSKIAKEIAPAKVSIKSYRHYFVLKYDGFELQDNILLKDIRGLRSGAKIMLAFRPHPTAEKLALNDCDDFDDDDETYHRKPNAGADPDMEEWSEDSEMKLQVRVSTAQGTQIVAKVSTRTFQSLKIVVTKFFDFMVSRKHFNSAMAGMHAVHADLRRQGRPAQNRRALEPGPRVRLHVDVQGQEDGPRRLREGVPAPRVHARPEGGEAEGDAQGGDGGARDQQRRAGGGRREVLGAQQEQAQGQPLEEPLGDIPGGSGGDHGG